MGYRDERTADRYRLGALEDELADKDAELQRLRSELAAKSEPAEVAQPLRKPAASETREPLTESDKKALNNRRIGFLGAGVGLLSAAYACASKGDVLGIVLAVILVLLGLPLVALVVASYVRAWLGR